MPYYTNEEISKMDKKEIKQNKLKRIKWIVKILNPIDENELKVGNYCSLKEIADENKFLPYDTWRNIAVGRSNIYEPFIKIEKDLERDLFYCVNNIENGSKEHTNTEAQSTTN